MRNYLLFLFLVLSLSHFCLGQDWEKFQWLSTNNIKTNSNHLTKLGEEDGRPLYFCRGKFRDHYYPGKFFFLDDNKNDYRCTIAADRHARNITTATQILYTPEGSVQWIAANGKIHENAIAVGSDANVGFYTYLCRVNHYNQQILGRIVPSDGKCYFPYKEHEANAQEYEILILTGSGRKKVVLITELQQS